MVQAGPRTAHAPRRGSRPLCRNPHLDDGDGQVVACGVDEQAAMQEARRVLHDGGVDDPQAAGAAAAVVVVLLLMTMPMCVVLAAAVLAVAMLAVLLVPLQQRVCCTAEEAQQRCRAAALYSAAQKMSDWICSERLLSPAALTQRQLSPCLKSPAAVS